MHSFFIGKASFMRPGRLAGGWRQLKLRIKQPKW